MSAYVFEAESASVERFLEEFHWLKDSFPHPQRPSDVGLQLEFLRNQKHGITGWLVVLPQRQKSFGSPLRLDPDLAELSVKERARIDRGFQVFGEREHRMIASWLADVVKTKAEHLVTPAGKATSEHRDPHQGILLVYPVREKAGEKVVYFGYEVLFPKNDLPMRINWAVRRTDDPDSIVVSAS